MTTWTSVPRGSPTLPQNSPTTSASASHLCCAPQPRRRSSHSTPSHVARRRPPETGPGLAASLTPASAHLAGPSPPAQALDHHRKQPHRRERRSSTGGADREDIFPDESRQRRSGDNRSRDRKSVV